MGKATRLDCPNCSHGLETLRRDKQAAGVQHVHLHWLICPSCGHVALYEWKFVEEVEGDESILREHRIPPSR